MKDHILIKIMRPEGYKDVSDQILMDDFLENPDTLGWDYSLEKEFQATKARIEGATNE